jgi:hypothetical protein
MWCSPFTHHVSGIIAMKRIVEPELLDELPPDDPLAVGSRRDLHRVNAWMRNHIIMAEALRNSLHGRAPEQITELGAGDGHFLLRVARRLASCGVPSLDGWNGQDSPNRANAELRTTGAWNEVKITLLDRQNIVTPQTLNSFTSLGWQAEAVTADVFDWLSAGNRADVVIVNLFLHHFHDASLAGMFRAVAGHARLLIAIEPRRAPRPLLCSRLLWLIGCNCVTRHDAVISVRAGFSGNELSKLWPDKPDWRLTEQSAGTFSHLFIAQKASPPT